MKPATLILIIVLLGCLNLQAHTATYIPTLNDSIHKLENPMSVAFLKKELQKKLPRLVLNTKIEKQLKQKIKFDPVVRNMYEAIKLNAQDIQEKPLLERIKTGRRLLSVSRKMLYRMNMLGIVYRVEKKEAVLERINEEVLAVCNFSDWNPSHYLDVAEMALAVAIAVDWTAGDLPKTTTAIAKRALIEKGIQPSYTDEDKMWWIKGTNNWNQVCHGGMIAAAIAVAEEAPELAAKTIHRALKNMPYALAEYGPDGVYPEGSTYWAYGTQFSTVTAAMLESAFGTDFGLGDYPGFQESAVFRALSIAPSEMYYNFADCGDRRNIQGDLTLAWFASKTGNPMLYERERFLLPPKDIGKLSRMSGAGIVWLAQFEPKTATTLPIAWKGDGDNPIVIFKGSKKDPHQYYFGGKGGRGTVNHGNMDAGSFVFELNGVRWVVDPGNQDYHELEKTGFKLWERCQECERWTLLTKNNFGHSTLSVNNDLHQVDGMASIVDFKAGEKPEATIDLTPTFEGQLKSATRRFVKSGRQSLLIEDEIAISDQTELVNWQLLTTATVELQKGKAILKQDGKVLTVELLSHPELSFSVIALDPPPLELDRTISNLKRLEIRFPAYLFTNGKGRITVELSGGN